jgi:hypothetical protein
MNTLPHDDSPDVASWLTEVGRRRAPVVHALDAEATVPPRVEPRIQPGRLFLLGVLFLSGVQYVYVTTMLTIVSLPALVFFGIR